MTTITRAATAAAICAAVLLTATACSSDSPKASAKESAADSPAAGTERDNVQQVDGASVAEAPKIDGKKTIASFANGKSGQTVPVKGGFRKGTIEIALNCEGKGTVQVEIPGVSMGNSLVQECTAGKVATISNEAAIGTDVPDASIKVTPSSGVSWSISVGQ